jgi:hypothetical protein
VEEVACSWIVAVAIDDLPFEVLAVMAKFPLNIRQLGVELIFLRGFRGP